MQRLFIVLNFVAALLVQVSQADVPRAADAPQPLSPAESAARVRLPPGFRMELVASEPLIQDPSCMAFDEQGRLFVCELHGYNVEGHLDVVELNKTGKLDTQVRRLRWELMGGEIAQKARQLQNGVVKLLSDRDEDGVMDHATVWADDLPPCYGIVPARGGILVVAAPDIVFLADGDGDGKVDQRETLYTGFATSVLERGINNPLWGLDNWIYVGSGRHAGTIRGPHLPQPVELGNQDFRIRADGTSIEPVSGSVGTFGLALHDFGDRFPCSGGQPAVYALPLPHRYLIRNPHVPTPATNYVAADYARGFRISEPHPWRAKRANIPEWVKFYGSRETDSSYFSGGCGGQIYRADLFPKQYRGNFFYCEPSLNIVHRCILQRDGAGYVARRAPEEQQSEFLASTDQWFRPMNLRVGPDGGLYIVDMYREIIEDYSAIPRFLQQQYGLMRGSDRGRIWRLTADAKKSDARTWPSHLSTGELVASTGDANAWWRHTAQRLLIERGDRSAAATLANQIRHGASATARVHALYTLHGLQELTPADVRHALGDQHYGVRLHALRLADGWLDKDSRLLAEVVQMTGDPDPAVRLQLAMTLGESDDARATGALLQLARGHGHERWMAAAIASSASDTAGPLLHGLLQTEDHVEQQQALVRPLAATVAGKRSVFNISHVLARLDDCDSATQALCLAGLVDGLSQGQDPVPKFPGAAEPLVALLCGSSPETSLLIVRLAKLLGYAEYSAIQARLQEAIRIAQDPDRSIVQRRESIELLADAPWERLASVLVLLDARQPPALQQAAIEALGKTTDERVAAALLSAWPRLTPDSRGEVLQAIMQRENRWPPLVDAIDQGVISFGDLSAMQRQQLAQSRNQTLVRRVRELEESMAAAPKMRARLENYRKRLGEEVDFALGKKLFEKHCLNCHVLGEKGHPVGPPLGTVVNKPDEAILADILDPSGHVESEYASYLVITRQGQSLTGVLAAESATSVTLRMEEGVEKTVLRKDIDVLRNTQVSLMPSDLHQQISPREMAHLIGFLRGVFPSQTRTN